MKIRTWKYAITPVLMFVATACFSQVINDYHSTLTIHSQKTKEHAKAIEYSTSKSAGQNKKHTEEAEKNLTETKKAFENMKKMIALSDSAIAKPYNAAIEKLLAAATFRITAMYVEFNKQDQNEAVIRQYAKQLHEDLDKVEKEHRVLKSKIKN